MTGPFSWATLPPVRVNRWINGKTFDLFEGSHAGYSRPHSSIVHRRFVFHPRADLWFVRDLVVGAGEHELEIAWHVGEGLAPIAHSELLFSDGRMSLAILTEEVSGWSRSVREFGNSTVYGKVEPARVVSFAGRPTLPAEFVTVLLAREKPEGDCGSIERISDSQSGGVSAYRYLDDRRECVFVFALESSPWAHGAWSSDGEFLYASVDHGKDARHLVLCGATHLDAGGNRIVSCARRVSYAEVWGGAEDPQISSSDSKAVSLDQPLGSLWPQKAVAATKKEQRFF